MKNLLIIFFFLFVITLVAQTTEPVKLNRPLTKREIAIRQIDYTLEKSTVLENLRKCYLALSHGDGEGKALPRVKYVSYKLKMEKFLKYKWFIADTGLSRKWFKGVYDLFCYMYKTRDIIESAIENKHTHRPEAKQAFQYYNVAYERFVKLIKKPVKVSGKLQRKLKLQKALWQKAMRKKYKIDKKAEPDFL